MAKQNNIQKGEDKMKKETAQTITNPISFKVEKMYRLPDAGNLKAFADISVNDVLIIKGVRIVSGKKGLFVSMPQEQGRDNKWYDQVVCKSAPVYEAFSEAVISHYGSMDAANV